MNSLHEHAPRGRRFAAPIAVALVLFGCSSGHGGSTSRGTATTSTGSAGTGGASSSTTTGTGGASSSTTTGTGGASAGSCTPDPLRTGLTAVQTGVSVDAFDCQILQWAAYYKEPDPMIFKAIIYVESRFDDTAVACPNDPCGTPKGWTTAESGCYGLMQIVPACGDQPGGVGLLPNGQPNLTTDPTAAGWAGSVFNPNVNIQTGISGVAGNRAQVEMQFSNCTVDEYTLMAIGNYNDYMSTTSCTMYNTAYDGPVVTAYKQYAAAAGYPAHNYP